MTATPSKFGTVQLGLIQLDPDTQPRAALNPETVEQYADDMRNGASFPPVVLFDERGLYWLADGWHRVHAARSKGEEYIRAEIREGSREDAILYGLSANANLPRSNEDKRRAVRVALELRKLAGKSDREIAAVCAVSHPFVAKVREELSGNRFQMPERREVTRGGTTYTMNVSAIGKREEPEQTEEELAEAKAEVEAILRETKAIAEQVIHATKGASAEPELEEADQPEPDREEEVEDEEEQPADDTEQICGRINAADELRRYYRRWEPHAVAALVKEKRRKATAKKADMAGLWLVRLADALRNLDP